MRLVGLTTVRDEDDIIFDALAHVAPLLDCGLIVDCGSKDSSIDEVVRATQAFPNLVYLGAVGPHYAEEVRRHVWSHCRKLFGADTWWMIVDADEYVEPDVRDRVRAATAEHADHMFSIHANFYYTDREFADWNAGRETVDDRARPIAERRRYYRVNGCTIRFFRHLPWLRWNDDTSFPRRLARPAKTRVLFRHYQYRDPIQIARRIAIRREFQDRQSLIADNPHWVKHSIQQCISDVTELEHWDMTTPLGPTEHTPSAPSEPAWRSLAKYGLAIAESAVGTRKPPSMLDGKAVRAAVEKALSAATARV